MSRTHVSGKRPGFTLVDLVVAVFLVALVGGILLASAPSMHKGAAREVSKNNLRQIALGTINCADTHGGKLPPGLGNFYPGAANVPNNGYGPCLFHILPYVEQDNVYKVAFMNVGPAPLYACWAGAGRTIKMYGAPGDPTLGDAAADRTSYLANGLALPAESARYPASITDGTSNTVMYAEAYSQAVGTLAYGGQTHTWAVERRWWDEPVWAPALTGLTFQVAPAKEAASASLPQGLSQAGIQVALADGSVRFVSSGCSAKTFFAACTPSGGEVLGSDW